jgi:hypothetical protein
MTKYRYNIKFQGATFSSNTMINVARLIANITKEPISTVYKKLVGRYPSHNQLIDVYNHAQKWDKETWREEANKILDGKDIKEFRK